MAFNTDNLYNIYSGPPGFGYYVYKSDIDTRTTVLASGYFNNDDDQINFNTDDLISVTGIEGGYKLRVTSVTDGLVATEAEIIGDSIFSLDGSGNMVFNEDGDDIDLRIEGDTSTHVLFVDAGNNRIGFSNASLLPTDGLVHIQSGTAGVVTANTSADELVIEGLIPGLSFLSPATAIQRILFGSPTSSSRATLRYDHGNDVMEFFAAGLGNAICTFGGSGAIFNEDGGAVLDFRVESQLNTHMFFVDASNNSIHIDNSLSTGAGDGDLVMANTKFLRWINSAGTSSANLGINVDGNDSLNINVNAVGENIQFLYAGSVKLFVTTSNSGAGITFSGESSADHGVPSANNGVIYTKDVAGVTHLFFRSTTGITQIT